MTRSAASLSQPAMSDADPAYLPYADDVETIPAGESELIDEIIASLSSVSRVLDDRYRHAVRPSHGKSHGLLKGTLRVLDDLPEPLAQGLFAAARTYPVAARISTEPGELMGDSVHTPRGFALKVIGVDGEMLAGHEGQVTQDILLSSGKRFAVADLKGFLDVQRFLEGIVNQPEGAKKAGTALGFAANGALHLVGSDSSLLDFFGHPHTHPLGETYFSHAPLRHGRYVAKLGLFPACPPLEALAGTRIDPKFEYSALKKAVVGFFEEHGAEYELRVQLRTNAETMLIEDASVEWPESESPFLPVARIVFPRQDAYSPARRAFMDDALSFTPAHGLAAHRPLGSLMRGRMKAYGAIAALRAEMNARPRVEPRHIDEIPD
ncbi:catalase family protein [Salinarimonas soli]|uniref:Catalase family protein n=1 Tax=Salinarimonas soli TaxID=1638099 RepID=A0A5B2W0Z7_9HYPH|nr:catalase family protein [Salinarimonas soli]KAA2244087.1 catalase family protein [Salinarimonas soli]